MDDGADHRRQMSGGKSHHDQAGHLIYYWLRDHQYPPGYLQVLCHSCNMARYRNGGTCPHEDQRQELIRERAPEELD